MGMNSRLHLSQNLVRQTWVRPGLLVYLLPAWAHHSSIEHVLDAVDWQQGTIQIFGKTHLEPRLTAWSGDRPYQYSHRALSPRPWCAPVRQLRDDINQLLAELSLAPATGVNHCLMNYYRDGEDSMGWHRDNEPELGFSPVVCSVSLGARRRFRLRPWKGCRDQALTFELGDGDLLVMAGATQHVWEHALLKTKQPIGPRLNLTFRAILDGREP
jgi:alkylated DNA repair dioxygenase AlkB